MIGRLATAASLLAIVLVSTHAREARAEGLDGQRFVPAAGAASGFVVERPLVPLHLGWGFGAFAAYGHRPVVVVDRARDEIIARPLANALSLDLVGSIGLFNFLELAAHVPLRPVWKGDDLTASGHRLNAGGGLGDARFVPKVQIFDLGTDTFWYALGAAVPVTFPTGKGTALRGSESVGFEPRLSFAIGGGRWDATFNVGYLMRTADKSLAGRTEVTFGGAFSYGIVQGKTGVDLQVEVYGAHLPDAQTSGSKTPVESLVGAVIWPSDDLGVYVGAGPGISAGLGSPDFRVAAGVRFGRRVPRRDRHGDRDHDGVENLHDQCPDAQEDQDGFQDNDGCPDPDNDGDGVLDDRDECPEAAEEPGGNGDGCPAKGRVIVEDGQMHVFGKVQFDTGSANIANKSEPLLDDLASVLKAHPEFKKVEIGGHTDDTGPKEVNEKLSKERAEAVKKALIKRGIAPERLETVGYGPSKPVSSNATAVGRARNRRVEFTVKE